MTKIFDSIKVGNQVKVSVDKKFESIEEKIHRLGKQNPISDWRDSILFRKENKYWLKKSFKIALMLLDIMEDNDWSKDDLSNKLNVERSTLDIYLSGSYDFRLSEIGNIEKMLDLKLFSICNNI